MKPPSEEGHPIVAPTPPPPPADAVAGDRAEVDSWATRRFGVASVAGAGGVRNGRSVRGATLGMVAGASALAVGGGEAVRAGAAWRRRVDRRSPVYGGGARPRWAGRAIDRLAPGIEHHCFLRWGTRHTKGGCRDAPFMGGARCESDLKTQCAAAAVQRDTTAITGA